MQDFGEEGVGSTWLIDASMNGGRALRARKNLVVRVLIFPQIVLETKAINTYKQCPLFEQHDNNSKNW